MRVFKFHGQRFALLAGLLVLCGTLAGTPAQAGGKYNIGTPATAQQIAGWNIDVFPDGHNLPAGAGTVLQGRAIYVAQCASCHGAQGQGGIGDKLAGGVGTLASKKPVRTVGSYWPYATTLYDYIRRSMPLTAPQTLSNDQVYAVTGYVLYLNSLVAEDASIDGKTLVQLKMPNRHGFEPDPRPDVKSPASGDQSNPK
ncbi:MAG: cytochrome c [Paralcaligenes sp.]